MWISSWFKTLVDTSNWIHLKHIIFLKVTVTHSYNTKIQCNENLIKNIKTPFPKNLSFIRNYLPIDPTPNQKDVNSFNESSTHDS